tara:strand:- start:2374 stop:2766 length:393 start_codon:yes stop_codon:yes gene_type:complete
MSDSPICQHHNQAMTWKTGTSKAGKPYAFWSCSQKEADGSWCSFKLPYGTPGPSNTVKFAAELDKSANQMDKQDRDKIITRLAIAKSLIEAGHKFSTETKFQAEQWLAWAEERKLLDNAPPPVDYEDVNL